MAQRQARRSWWVSVTVFVAVLVATTAVVGVAYLRHREVAPDDVDCTHAKCVALTFDDGTTPFTDRLLHVLTASDAKATFFLVGNKVAADPASARRIADAGMEIGNHTWE
ncbi:MAG: polysaccharide deacetylase family protein, partial [Mycobacterium sp.]